MDDAKWLAVVIGVVGALFGVYFRENLRRAFNQKRIAAQLDAYLSHWELALLKHDLGNVVLIVQGWEQERDAAVREKGKAGFIEVWEKQKAQVQQLKARIKSGGAEIMDPLKANHQMLRTMPEAVFQATMDDVAAARDALLQNRTFISDQDAAELARWAAHRVVSLRGNLLSLLGQVRIFGYTLRNSETLDFIKVSDNVVQIIEKLVDIAYEMQSLKSGVTRISDRSILRLALDNMQLKA